MPDYFLFLLLLIAALSHALCHSILKYNKNPLGILGITSIFEIIIFTPLVLSVPYPTTYIWILIINAIISWLVAFNILNTGNRFVYSVLDVSHRLTDPALNYIRRFLPNLGSIDISPVVLILALLFIRNLVFEMFAPSLF